MNNLNQIEKIVTHSGIFHADEVLAIAFLYSQGLKLNFPIDRKNEVDEDELNDPHIAVIDVGKHYDPQKNNFDHHQDLKLQSSNVLILENFYDFGLNNEEKEVLKERFFNQISMVDRGVINPQEENKDSFSNIIRNMNNLENGFHMAISISIDIVNAYIETCKKEIEGKKKWEKLKTDKKETVKIIENEGEFIPDWQSLAKQDDIMFLITPNIRKTGTYNLISRDSREFIIPEKDNQDFRHPSGFMASYYSIEDAIQHAQEIKDNQ